MKANILECGLLMIISDDEADPVFALLPFAGVHEIKYRDSKAIEWIMYDFDWEMITAVAK